MRSSVTTPAQDGGGVLRMEKLPVLVRDSR